MHYLLITFFLGFEIQFNIYPRNTNIIVVDIGWLIDIFPIMTNEEFHKAD